MLEYVGATCNTSASRPFPCSSSQVLILRLQVPSPMLFSKLSYLILFCALRCKFRVRLFSSNLTASKAYSLEIIRYLLDHWVVCSTMVEAPGGLLGALRARNNFILIFWIFYRFNCFSELYRAGVWCRPCLKEFGIIETLISQYGRSAVQSLASAIPSLPVSLHYLPFSTSQSPTQHPVHPLSLPYASSYEMLKVWQFCWNTE